MDVHISILSLRYMDILIIVEMLPILTFCLLNLVSERYTFSDRVNHFKVKKESLLSSKILNSFECSFVRPSRNLVHIAQFSECNN